MNYIVMALKSEAQAFADRFKLKKTQLKNYTLFFNDTIKIIVSGIGVEKARVATQTLINHYDLTDNDRFYNIGVCGANQSFAIGSLLEIGSITYENSCYSFGGGVNIRCSDAEVTHDRFSVVDMECYGFYDAVIHNPAIKHFRIYKVVSDHFKPHTLTKDMVKSLIFNQIENMGIF
ncbi:MAG: hypothetical protein FAF05_05700 [Epsilonproteobacteria bacterium]|nr:hypothetical protein [Campylobacterota bacterium]